MKLLFEHAREGKNTYRIPGSRAQLRCEIPDDLTRSALDLPDVSEVEVVRHYTMLSRMNFGVDTGMYPLGSCTMKHNPKLNERIAAMKGFTDMHPLCGDASSQGALEVLYVLGSYLCKITGMDAITLNPSAGSHGELTGLMMIKKYFEDRNEKRDVILVPDTAHGTNPASAAMCGFKAIEVPSGPSGDVDLNALKSLVNPGVAAMMLTCPSTLGLFERGVGTISNMLRDNGSLFYADGANLNALIGKVRMRDLGFDLMHLNLHKTFSTPHGGGGPGSGPVCVSSALEPYLPVPVIESSGGSYHTSYDRPMSIGCVHTFYGNFLVALRAYAYLKRVGADGLPEISENAVLHANYIMSALRGEYPPAIDRRCMHEFVLSDASLPGGVTANDLAKRLLDFGLHAPTVYFPLIVNGAIMIEPTETESRESMDAFIDAMIRIKRESETDPDTVKNAPHDTPVGRIDQVLAARKPVLKWE